DAIAPAQRSIETLEEIAARVIASSEPGDTYADGVAVDHEVCFQMVVGHTVLGVVGVVNDPPLSASDRRAFGAAVALLAIAIRNVQLLAQSRESSVRDHLTGCFNRLYGLESLTNELKR